MSDRAEEGIVLAITLLVMLMMSALGVALVLLTSSESLIAANFRNSREALQAAEAAAERAMSDLGSVADWTQVLNGSTRSTFVDGSSTGTRALSDGSTLDLSEVVNQANCHKATTCSSAEMDAVNADRPWGANNPRWQMYAHGPLTSLLPSGIDSTYYAAVLVGDDSSENDNDPRSDGADSSNPGSGLVVLRTQAFGPRGTHKTVDLTVTRAASGAIRLLSWREIR